MRRKIFIGLAPLLAVAALTVPAAASAAPQWFVNGSELKEGKTVDVVTWGLLSLKSAAGEITCKTIDSAENIGGGAGGPGKDIVKTAIFYDCVSAGCPGTITATAEPTPPNTITHLGWPTVLEEIGPGEFRDRGTEIKVRIKCVVGEVTPLNTIFAGELAPLAKNGSSAAKPSFTEYDPGSGELISPEVGPGKTTGKDKSMGFLAQEVITVK